MKVLILSSNNGSGHNSAGQAVMEPLTAAGIECQCLDAVSFRSRKMSNAIRSIHVNGALYAPWLFKLGNDIAAHSDTIKSHSMCYALNMSLTKSICEYVSREGFDTVVCTHVFPALALSHGRRNGMLHARIYFIATDYDCTPYIEEGCLDGYFIPHAALTEEYVRRGVLPDRIYPTGIPVSKRFRQHMDSIDARRELGLPLDGAIALFMGGSMGFGKVKTLVAKMLREGSKDMTAVVLVGNNRELYNDLVEKYQYQRVIPIGYTNKVDLYMDASDVLFTKPGGLSSTEAAVKGIPLVHTDPIPGWETDNAMFFQKLGMCKTGTSIREYVDGALELLGSPELRQNMRLCQHKNINPYAAEDIVRVIRNDAD